MSGMTCFRHTSRLTRRERSISTDFLRASATTFWGRALGDQVANEQDQQEPDEAGQEAYEVVDPLLDALGYLDCGGEHDVLLPLVDWTGLCRTPSRLDRGRQGYRDARVARNQWATNRVIVGRWWCRALSTVGKDCAMDPDWVDPDRDLVTRARGGDLAAFETLVKRHRDVVYRVAARTVGSAACQDVSQEHLRAFHRLPRFRGEGPFRAWLLRITQNTALTQNSTAARAGRSPSIRWSRLRRACGAHSSRAARGARAAAASGDEGTPALPGRTVRY